MSPHLPHAPGARRPPPDLAADPRLDSDTGPRGTLDAGARRPTPDAAADPRLDPDTGRRMARALRFLEAEALAQPRLADVARHVRLSEHHFQRLFKRWVGISPKRYLQVLTADRAAALLRTDVSTLEATYGSGLSSPSRLHDLFVALHAVTPGELKRAGADLTLRWGTHDTPFGPALLAASPRGLVTLAFLGPAARDDVLEGLHQHWPRATLLEDPPHVAPYVERVFGPATRDGAQGAPLTLHVRGTNFQTKVWEALLAVPPGQLTTYGELASGLGRPRAARAVGQAVAANPVAWLIPCHRVIRESGLLGGYRWGPDRKRVMLTLEAAQALATPRRV